MKKMFSSRRVLVCLERGRIILWALHGTCEEARGQERESGPGMNNLEPLLRNLDRSFKYWRPFLTHHI